MNNNKFKILILCVCLTLCCNNCISAMENDYVPVRIKLSNVKNCLSIKNIFKIKSDVMRRNMMNQKDGAITLSLRKFEKDANEFISIMDNAMNEYEEIDLLEKNIIANIKFLRDHGAPQNICDEIEDFIKNFRDMDFTVDDIEEFANIKLKEISKALLKNSKAWIYSNPPQNKSNGATRFLELKDDINQLLNIYKNMERKWELKNSITNNLMFLMTKGAPKDICDKILRAINDI